MICKDNTLGRTEPLPVTAGKGMEPGPAPAFFGQSINAGGAEMVKQPGNSCKTDPFKPLFTVNNRIFFR
jgi:hypothetical protein